jgi:outer membrane lipoprotein-sorting protein
MKHFLLIAFALLSFRASTAHAQTPDAMDIVVKAVEAMNYAGGDVRARIDMRIIDSHGRERIRQMTMLRRNEAPGYGPQKYYVFFSRPSDVKEMVFMAWKNIDRADDRWLYLPALDLVKRIAASDERTRFVGSHFFYEDVSGRNIDEDSHEFVEETDDYYVIKSTPKDLGDVEFTDYTSWVDKTTYLPMRMEYTNKRGEVYRTFSVQTVETIQDHPTIIDVEMEDAAMGGKTVLHYSAVKYSIGIKENIFSERFLRRPPREYLR